MLLDVSVLWYILEDILLYSPIIISFQFWYTTYAVDADHIAAIDNVTRKLIRDGRKPLTVGLWFSLGHSTIVVILCIVIAAGSTYARDHLDSASSVGSIVGTIVSATRATVDRKSEFVHSISTLGSMGTHTKWKRSENHYTTTRERGTIDPLS